MIGLEAWENQLFDEYNGERKRLDEIEADLYDELEYERDRNMKKDSRNVFAGWPLDDEECGVCR